MRMQRYVSKLPVRSVESALRVAERVRGGIGIVCVNVWALRLEPPGWSRDLLPKLEVGHNEQTHGQQRSNRIKRGMWRAILTITPYRVVCFVCALPF